MAKRYDRGTVAGESKRSFLQFPRGIVFSRNAVSSESRTVLKRHSLHVKEANFFAHLRTPDAYNVALFLLRIDRSREEVVVQLAFGRKDGER